MIPEDVSPLARALADIQAVLAKVPWRRLVVVTGWTVLGLGTVAAIALFVFVRQMAQGLPDVHQLAGGYAPPQVTRILARDGTLLADIFSERRTVVPFERMPDHLKSAFLAAEDATFYEHEGLDYLGLLRALAKNLAAGRVKQGGSTITQQVVKNVLLDQERSYRRKVRETILAYEIERTLSKDQILAMYMNHLYLGHGRYGVEEAGVFYFGKHVENLDPAESALLAGIISSPEHYSPRKNEKLALERRRYVLGQMKAKGFMTEDAYLAYADAPLRLTPVPENESDLAPEVVTLTRSMLDKVVGERARRGGFRVQTTIDPTLQVAARKAVREGLDAYLKRHKLAPPYTLEARKLWAKPFTGIPVRHGIYVGKVTGRDDAAGTVDVRVGSVHGRVQLSREDRYNPGHLTPTNFVGPEAALRVRLLEEPRADDSPVALALELGPQAALVALDPESGEVRALVGNYEALPGGLDRATSARRQPGSTFKPIFYSYALGTGAVTPATTFTFPVDTKAANVALTVDGSSDLAPTIEILSLRQGVARSDNRVAREVFGRVGAENVVAFARALGVTSRLGADDSLALGSYEMTPIELGAAYIPLAAAGRMAEPVFVTAISGEGGPVPLPQGPPPRAVMKPEVAYLMTSLLESVVQEGTAKRALSLGRPVAGKTGTTNKVKDAWFVGYSVDLVVAVWVGYDDASPLGAAESGASAALPIWIDFMKAAHEGKPKVSFPRPPGIVEAKIDPATGLLARYEQADAINEIFLAGTAPTETAPEAPAEVLPAGAPTGEDAEAPGVAADGDLPVEPDGPPETTEPPAPLPSDAAGEPEPPAPTGPTEPAHPVPEPPPF
jgi:penicillin-binding protein 1A